MRPAIRFAVFASLVVAGSATAQLRAPAGSPGAPAPGAPQRQDSAPAPVDPLTREFRDCLQKAQAAMQAKKAEDPAAILACLTGEVKRQEGKIAGTSEKMIKVMPAEGKKRLDEANAAWRRYRDANCRFFADPKGPPQIAINHADCSLNHTVQRAIELDRLMGMLAQQAEAVRAATQAAPADAAAAAAAPAATPPGDAKK